MLLGPDLGTASTPCNLIARAFHLSHHWSFKRGSQWHKNWAGAITVGCGCDNHWAAEARQLRLFHWIKNNINLAACTLLTSHIPTSMLHLFLVPHFHLSNSKSLVQSQAISFSISQWPDRTIQRVTNNLAVNRKSGMVRCSPHAPEF